MVADLHRKAICSGVWGAEDWSVGGVKRVCRVLTRTTDVTSLGGGNRQRGRRICGYAADRH